MTRNQNHDDASWSDLDHDVLFVVMMKLGVVDFLSFSGVCKSWRSVALSNRNNFMASVPPMSMWISIESNEKVCYLKDFQGRKFKTLLPQSDGRKFVGLTCGYLILFGRETTKDFWLVNPITRHQLHFPHFPYNDFPFHVNPSPPYFQIRAILVFSPSISGWLFVITERFRRQVWFSIADKGVWNHISTNSQILDLHAFKGKIYTLNSDYYDGCAEQLYEMRFGTDPKLMLLKTKNFPKTKFYPEFVNSDENLHVVECISGAPHKFHELDFGEMKWVYREETEKEYTFYRNYMNGTSAVKRESWAGTDKSRKGWFNYAYMWYIPHDCVNVNLIDE